MVSYYVYIKAAPIRVECNKLGEKGVCRGQVSEGSGDQSCKQHLNTTHSQYNELLRSFVGSGVTCDQS